MSKSRSNKLSGLTGLVPGAGVCLALLSVAAPASASIQPHDPPIPASIASAPGYDHTYNDPSGNQPDEVQPVQPQSDGLHTTSVTLGALGGIVFAGACLGVTLGVQRRRHHSALHSA